MKWRERISILSRKRKPNRNVAATDNAIDRISAAGSSSTDRANVEKTLSQIRPVIGPDHKSYYILLRGNEDSFTCIQPAKEVITSLDEVVKNVVNSVKQTRPPATLLPPYLKASRSYRNASKKCTSDSNRKANGLSSSVNKEIRVTRTLNSDGSCDDKSEEKFLGTENVVENVVLHRTVQTKNCSHNEVTRTSTLVYPLVQNRLDASGHLVGTNKQETCSFVPNKKSHGRELPSIVGTPSVRELGQNPLPVNPNFLKQEPTVYEKQVADQHIRHETEVQMHEHISISDETFVPESVRLPEKTKPVTEIRLMAKEGCVLTEENITEQVKALIESETLVIGEDSHIVLTRGNAQEIILRISAKDPEESQLFEDHPMKQDDFDFSDDILHQQEEFQSQADVLTLPDSTLQEEICYNPNMADDSSNNCDPEARVQYLLTSLSPSPQEMFDDCDVKDAVLRKVFQDEREDDINNYCLMDPSSLEADQIEVERLLLNSDSLLSQNEGILVIQRPDGSLVNQDGTPISSELQYFANHVFLSTKP